MFTKILIASDLLPPKGFHYVTNFPYYSRINILGILKSLKFKNVGQDKQILLVEVEDPLEVSLKITYWQEKAEMVGLEKETTGQVA